MSETQLLQTIFVFIQKAATSHKVTALWVLSNIAQNSVDDSISVIKHEGLVKQVLEYLNCKNERLVQEASFVLNAIMHKLISSPDNLDHLFCLDLLSVLKDQIERNYNKHGGILLLSLDTIFSLLSAKESLIDEFEYMGGFEAVEAN